MKRWQETKKRVVIRAFMLVVGNITDSRETSKVLAGLRSEPKQPMDTSHIVMIRLRLLGPFILHCTFVRGCEKRERSHPVTY